jgi:phosphopantothenoylcysteine decarboxylase/phosphopantothenate--cysteine ligase
MEKNNESFLKGLHILITAGPTREMWDSVRYLTNLSSGKVGFAIAEKAAEYGADVTLITSISDREIPGVKQIHINSAMEMFEAVKKESQKYQIFISSAAVADFRPVKVDHKIKKNGEVPVIHLERNPDILKWVTDNYPDKLNVGFALEDEMDVEKGTAKKERKNCRLMILNDAGNLGSDMKSFVLISDDDAKCYNSISLGDTAEVILRKCRELI